MVSCNKEQIKAAQTFELEEACGIIDGNPHIMNGETKPQGG